MSSRESLEAAERDWERRVGWHMGRCERAEALVARYRAALEQIAGYGCEFFNEGVHCAVVVSYQPHPDAKPCPSCVARAALEEK